MSDVFNNSYGKLTERMYLYGHIGAFLITHMFMYTTDECKTS